MQTNPAKSLSGRQCAVPGRERDFAHLGSMSNRDAGVPNRELDDDSGSTFWVSPFMRRTRSRLPP